MKEIHTRIDINFKSWLNDIKAKRVLRKIDKKMNGDVKITKEMMRTPSFKKVEEELLYDKRGAITDLFVIIVIALVLILFFAGLIFFYNQLTGVLINIPSQTGNNVTINISQAAQQTLVPVNNSMAVWYWMTGLLVFGMFIAFLIASYFTQSHPIFFIGYIFVVIMAIIVAVYISNAYEDVRIVQTLGTTIQNMTILDHILLNLPIIITVFGFLGAILMYVGIKLNESSGSEFE